MPNATELELLLYRLAYRAGYKRSQESESVNFEELVSDQEEHLKRLIDEYKLGLKEGWDDTNRI